MPATLNNVVGIARDLYPDEMIAQIGGSSRFVVDEGLKG